MQIHDTGQLELAIKARSLYLFDYPGQNEIGDKGC